LFLFFKKAAVAATLIVIASEAYFVWRGDTVPGNLWIMLCGLVGMSIGETIWPVFIRTIRSSLARRRITNGVIISAVAAYFIVQSELGFNRIDLPVYLWGIPSIVALFYLAYGWFLSMPTLSSWLQLLGRYSLISYIVQMALIQLVKSLQSSLAVAFSFWLIFGVVLFTMGLMIAALDREIRKRKTLQKSYQFVFG
jgi:hypothetical protein